jgi:hypothetical protein
MLYLVFKIPWHIISHFKTETEKLNFNKITNFCSVKDTVKSLASMAHAYNPTHLKDWDQEDHGSRPAQANSLWEPHLQNSQTKMNWRCGSSSGTPALQVQSTEFKPQSHQKGKTKISVKRIKRQTIEWKKIFTIQW